MTGMMKYSEAVSDRNTMQVFLVNLIRSAIMLVLVI